MSPASAQKLPQPKRATSEGLVLVVDDMPDVRQVVVNALTRSGYEVKEAENGEACVAALTRILPDAVYLDLEMPGIGGLETLKQIRARNPGLPTIVLTGDSNTETVVVAMRLGAFDYLVKPVGARKLVTVARNAVEKHRMELRLASLEREASGVGYPELVGRSAPMLELFRQMDRLANTDIALLVHGESGTGKELVARAIHAHSARSNGPCVTVNCAAIPENLHESELFGHERGAFTGATTARMGKFELANKGTLFLDEVGELTLPLQAKLLRVLQDNRFHRVGGMRELRSDFRLIAATHRDLGKDVRAGKFREDLFYRIVVYELEVPPLRERRGDISQLMTRFLEEGRAPESPKMEVSSEALSILERYPWPGNVRELRNVMQRATVLADRGRILPEHLPARVRFDILALNPRSRGSDVAGGKIAASLPPGLASPPEGLAADEELNLERLERRAIARALALGKGNVTDVSRSLGISRATLYRKIKKYGLS